MPSRILTPGQRRTHRSWTEQTRSPAASSPRSRNGRTSTPRIWRWSGRHGRVALVVDRRQEKVPGRRPRLGILTLPISPPLHPQRARNVPRRMSDRALFADSASNVQDQSLRSAQRPHCRLSEASLNGGAARLSRPFVLCGSHGHSVRRTVGQTHVYASLHSGRTSASAAPRAFSEPGIRSTNRRCGIQRVSMGLVSRITPAVSAGLPAR